eukprot:Hpha_TRINITY_DN26557_c0_g1::TRINITY_DN26557_c0_g1_i1::g.112999::m.112999
MADSESLGLESEDPLADHGEAAHGLHEEHALLAMESDSEGDDDDAESLSEGEIEKTALAALDQFQSDALGSLKSWSDAIIQSAARLREVRRKRKSWEAERDKLRERKKESEEETDQLRELLRKDRLATKEGVIDDKKEELRKKKEELKRVRVEIAKEDVLAKKKLKKKRAESALVDEEVRKSERKKHLQKLRKVLKVAAPRLFDRESSAAVVRVLDHPTAKLFHPPAAGPPPTPAQRSLYLLLAVARGEVDTQPFFPAAKRQRVEKAKAQISLAASESDEYESYYEEEEVEEEEFEEVESSRASTESPPRMIR